MTEAAQIADLRARVAKLERAVAFFERHLGVKFEDAHRGDVSPQVIALVRGGDKLGAIALHRKLAGVGLKEAKDLVDTIE